MSEFFLDFEKPIFDVQKRIDELIEMNSKDGEDHSKEITRLSQKKDKLTNKIYNNLNRWQRVQ